MRVVDGQRARHPSATTQYDPVSPLRRGALLVTASLAGVGGAVTTAAAVPALWRIWQLYAMLFGALAVVEVVAMVAVLGWPTRKTARFAALSAGASSVLWVLSRPLGLFERFDPWQPADTVVGFTDYVVAALQVIALFGLLVVGRWRADPRPSALRRVSAWIVLSPVLLLVLATGTAGVVVAGDGATEGSASRLLDDGSGTFEYCRPAGIPLAVDVYQPKASATPAPVVLYLHGGGLVFGNRKPAGPGALLDGHRFTAVRDALTARGVAVASIDYRLAPAAPWPAALTDAKCAVRFLAANATALRLDPARIAAWGTGTGGTLAALLGLAPAGFDVGEYAGVPSTVRAVAAVSAPADFTDFAGVDTVTRASVLIAVGQARRAASPLTYVGPGAPPFLIGGGGRKSGELADRLRAAGVPVTTGDAVADFLVTALP